MQEWCHHAPNCSICKAEYAHGPHLPLLCIECCEEFNKIDHRSKFKEELDMDWDFE